MTQAKIEAARAAARERRRRISSDLRRETAPPAHALLPHGTHAHGSRPPFWERQWLATYEVLLRTPAPGARSSRRAAKPRKG